jgi:predicted RNA methylase
MSSVFLPPAKLCLPAPSGSTKSNMMGIGCASSGPSKIVACKTDEEAIEFAQQFLDDTPIEVWLGPKRIGRLEPDNA